MNPDIICRMSSAQIATAIDRLQRELAALQADLQVLQAKQDRRMGVMPNRRSSTPEE